MKPSSPIEVIIADDHPLVRASFKLVVKQDPTIKLVGEACNGHQLLELARELKPDIIITDIMMPGISGIEATKILAKELPDIGIIALSMVEKENLIIDMLEAGAKGYLLKSDPIEDLAIAIKAVYKGQTYFSKDVLNSVARSVASGSFNDRKPQFSETENAIIKLICQENSNKEIADILEISIRTVEWNRMKILEKIGAKNTAGIVVYAMRNNLYE